MIVCADIIELHNNVINQSFNNLSVRVDTTYGFFDIWIHHLFKDERVLIDCMRQYNRIQPIRQNINLHLSNLVNATDTISMNFNNIQHAFINTKKAAQKKYILDHVSFYNRVSRLFYSFDIVFDKPLCVFRPRYEVQFEVPIVFGQDPNEPMHLSGFEFIRFVSFLMIYTMQSLISAAHHHSMKPKHAGITDYKYECDINFSLLSMCDQRVIIDPSVLDCELGRMSVNQFYPKFFEG